MSFRPREGDHATTASQNLNRSRVKWQSLTEKYSQATLTDDELCELFPPPAWMRENGRRMWCDCIRSYERGQFKRYNIPLLEQYVLVYFNLMKLTKRLGYTSGLVKPVAELDSEGSVVMETKPTKELELYSRLLTMIVKLHSALHMPPRPYIFAINGNDEEEVIDLEISQSSQGKDRLRLVGGRAARMDESA